MLELLEPNPLGLGETGLDVEKLQEKLAIATIKAESMVILPLAEDLLTFFQARVERMRISNGAAWYR